MRRLFTLSFALALSALVIAATPQSNATGAALDARVKKFLDDHRYGWRDLNVPESDGRALFDLVLKNGYKHALEIGTSTGHSGIWIAWALSRTGGRLITIDIDEGRHREAKRNFEAAGLAPFIDARLADAHDLVPKLDGPFDFVFVDADKEWYTNYAEAVLPKLTIGGSLTAHNVSPGGWRQMTGDYYDFVRRLPFMQTSFSAGVCVSRKLRDPGGDVRPELILAAPPASEGDRMLAAVNDQRRDRRLPPLTLDARLSRAAMVQARDLARTGRFEHVGSDGSRVSDRVTRAGYHWSTVAENLAKAPTSSVQAIVRMWMNSRGHRENLLNRQSTQMGLAHVRDIWVLVLARPG